jgi:hypothetical protein
MRRAAGATAGVAGPRRAGTGVPVPAAAAPVRGCGWGGACSPSAAATDRGVVVPFRIRKSVNVIPGLVRLNASCSTSRGKGTSGGASWTFHLGRLVSYNTRTGTWTVNPPGPGSWQSSTRAQRRRRREGKRRDRSADRDYWDRYFADLAAGREPDLSGPPSQRGPDRHRRRTARPARTGSGGQTGPRPGSSGGPAAAAGTGPQTTTQQVTGQTGPGQCGARTLDGTPCRNPAGCTIPGHRTRRGP